MNEIGNPSEQRDLNYTSDFKKIFVERLNNIQPSDYSSWSFLKGLEEVGITKVDKMGFAVVFVTAKENGEDSDLQIWMKDEQQANKEYPHIDVLQELENYLEEHKIKSPRIFLRNKGMVLQANDGSLYLLVGGGAAEGMAINVGQSAADDFSREQIAGYERMMAQYSIKEIVAKGFANLEEKYTTYGTRNIKILNKDILGEITENRYLLSFAEKYGMTNNQFMRFRIRAITSRKAALTDKEAAEKGVKYLIDLDQLAQEIISQEAGEGHL